MKGSDPYSPNTEWVCDMVFEAFNYCLLHVAHHIGIEYVSTISK